MELTTTQKTSIISTIVSDILDVSTVIGDSEKVVETKLIAPTFLTKLEAESIYTKLKAGKTETEIFIEDGIDFKDSKKVTDEIKRIKKELAEKTNAILYPPIIEESSSKILGEI